MTLSTPRTVLSLVAVLAFAAAPLARAQEAGGVRADAKTPPFQAFSSTNVQLLQGYDFDDPLYYTGGRMTTVTLNHFSTWEYGDNFAFVDFYGGRFENGFAPAGLRDRTVDYKLYAEWHPRIFVNRLLGMERPLLGFIRNWGPAFELNQSEGFAAYLAGVGFDFAVPGFSVLGLNLFYRYDSVLSDNHDQWQVSPYWTIDLPVPQVPVRFTGFVDVNGTHDFAADESYVEVWAQPQLLVDVLAPFGGKRDRLWAGVEWFYHRHPVRTASVPQVMLQWTVY